MTKVPFDWDVFQNNAVIVEFLSEDDVKTFEENRKQRLDVSRDIDFGGIVSQAPYYNMFRFRGGVWLNMGDKTTYEGSMYNGYYHMVYEPGIDSKPVEVGDLI